MGANGEGRVVNGGGSPDPFAIRHSPFASDAKARKGAVEFETMFLEQMLERVFATGGEEGPLGENGAGGGVYRSMLVKEYAGAMTKAGGVGIADAVYREMLKIQENARG